MSLIVNRRTVKSLSRTCKTKYSDITNIARTYASVEQTGRFDAELAQHMPKTLVSLSHNGAGYDQIDVQPFTDKGIQVSNVTVPVEGPTAVTAVFWCCRV